MMQLLLLFFLLNLVVYLCLFSFNSSLVIEELKFSFVEHSLFFNFIVQFDISNWKFFSYFYNISFIINMFFFFFVFFFFKDLVILLKRILSGSDLQINLKRWVLYSGERFYFCRRRLRRRKFHRLLTYDRELIKGYEMRYRGINYGLIGGSEFKNFFLSLGFGPKRANFMKKDRLVNKFLMGFSNYGGAFSNGSNRLAKTTEDSRFFVTGPLNFFYKFNCPNSNLLHNTIRDFNGDNNFEFLDNVEDYRYNLFHVNSNSDFDDRRVISESFLGGDAFDKASVSQPYKTKHAKTDIFRVGKGEGFHDDLFLQRRIVASYFKNFGEGLGFVVSCAYKGMQPSVNIYISQYNFFFMERHFLLRDTFVEKVNLEYGARYFLKVNNILQRYVNRNFKDRGGFPLTLEDYLWLLDRNVSFKYDFASKMGSLYNDFNVEILLYFFDYTLFFFFEESEKIRRKRRKRILDKHSNFQKEYGLTPVFKSIALNNSMKVMENVLYSHKSNDYFYLMYNKKFLDNILDSTRQLQTEINKVYGSDKFYSFVRGLKRNFFV